MASLILLNDPVRPPEGLDPRGTVLGRLPTSDVVLTDPGVSRQHARIWRVGESWRIEDLESRAGVKVDDRQVLDQVLEHGSVIQLGAVRLRFVDEAADRNRSTAETLPVRRDDRHDIVSAHAISESRLLKAITSAAEPTHAIGQVVRLALRCQKAQDDDAVIAVLLEEAVQATGATDAAVVLLDRDQPITFRAKQLVPSRTFVRRIHTERAAVIALQVSEDEELSAAASLGARPVVSMLGAPLWTESRISGVVYLERRDGPFGESTVELLLALCFLGAAELERRASARTAQGEREKRRNMVRLLPAQLAERMASVSGEVRLQESQLAVCVAVVHASDETPEDELAAYVATVHSVIERDLGHARAQLDKDRLLIFEAVPVDASVEHAAQNIARQARDLMRTGEALRSTRPAWAELRLKAALHVGPGMLSEIGSESATPFLHLSGRAMEQAEELVRGTRPGRIRVSEGASPYLVQSDAELVLEREAGGMAVWMSLTGS